MFQNLLDKICFTALCRTHYQSENLWRKLNSGQGLVSIDAVTFRAAFVGCRTEQGRCLHEQSGHVYMNNLAMDESVEKRSHPQKDHGDSR